MNFTCDNCQKRYSIADEKVRGKTVKVRCKNCQNVITVEGPAEEESTRVVSLADVERIRAQERSLAEPAAAPAPVAAAPVARAPVTAPAPAPALQTPWDDEPTRAAPLKATGSPWFVMVRNKQEGPLDEGALREWIATGAISGRSFFWQQGMADWKRGSDIPELAGLFAPLAAPEPPPPPPPPVAEPPPARSGRGLSARREPEPQAFMPEPEQPSEPEQQGAWDSQQQEEPEQTLYQEPEQRSHSQGRRGQAAASAAGGAPLNELFSDLDLPGNRGAGDEGGEDDGRAQQDDPLAALGGGDGDERHPVEDTRHFAAKSGVTRRNPAWKYAVFVLLLLVIPLGGAYLLSETLGVVPLRVQTVDAQGNAVEETVFSTKGVGALRDKLLGRTPPAPAPKPPPPAEKRPAAPAPQPESAPADKAPAGAAGTETGATAPAPSAEQLQAVYADADKKDVGPDVRKDAEVAATDSDEVGGPSDEEVERVVDKAQEAFRNCVENELRKNPSFRVGKVTLTATVGSSGKVKAATLDKPALNRSNVGTCIRDRAKSMVFSAFSGDDVDLEIPLVLSGAM